MITYLLSHQAVTLTIEIPQESITSSVLFNHRFSPLCMSNALQVHTLPAYICLMKCCTERSLPFASLQNARSATSDQHVRIKHQRENMRKVYFVRIMQSKSCRYGDERTLIVRSHMGERAVYYIGVSRARPNQALARATE